MNKIYYFTSEDAFENLSDKETLSFDFIGEDLLLNEDSFLVVDGSILLGATIGLI
jgi:hypothetical protein